MNDNGAWIDKAVGGLERLLGFAPAWILVIAVGVVALIALLRWGIAPNIRASRGKNGKDDD